MQSNWLMKKFFFHSMSASAHGPAPLDIMTESLSNNDSEPSALTPDFT
jgi:hypothetical protein